jgi:hypothetical protein
MSSIIIVGAFVASMGCTVGRLAPEDPSEGVVDVAQTEGALDSAPTLWQIVKIRCDASFEEPRGLAQWVRQYCRQVGKSTTEFAYAVHLGKWGDNSRAFFGFNIPDKGASYATLRDNYPACAEPYVVPAAKELRDKMLANPNISDECKRRLRQIPERYCHSIHNAIALRADGTSSGLTVKQRLSNLNGPAFRSDCVNIMAVDPNWFSIFSSHWKLA